MERRGAFDYILLETTGLADPGNLAPLFWVDEGLGSTIYLDGIVTLIDAKNILKSLEEHTNLDSEHVSEPTASGLAESSQPASHSHKGPELSTAHLQISHADVVVINKADLVTADQLEAVKQRIQSINALAKIHITQHSQIPQLEGVILDLHAYDNVDAASLDFATKGHSHLDPSISTVALTVPLLHADQLPKLDSWLQALLWEGLFLAHPDASAGERDPASKPASADRTDIHRIKGRLPTVDGKTKMLQGVREVFELLDGADVAGTGDDQIEQQGKIVVIGRNIGDEEGRAKLQRSLDAALLDR